MCLSSLHEESSKMTDLQVPSPTDTAFGRGCIVWLLSEKRLPAELCYQHDIHPSTYNQPVLVMEVNTVSGTLDVLKVCFQISHLK